MFPAKARKPSGAPGRLRSFGLPQVMPGVEHEDAPRPPMSPTLRDANASMLGKSSVGSVSGSVQTYGAQSQFNQPQSQMGIAYGGPVQQQPVPPQVPTYQNFTSQPAVSQNYLPVASFASQLAGSSDNLRSRLLELEAERDSLRSRLAQSTVESLVRSSGENLMQKLMKYDTMEAEVNDMAAKLAVSQKRASDLSSRLEESRGEVSGLIEQITLLNKELSVYRTDKSGASRWKAILDAVSKPGAGETQSSMSDSNSPTAVAKKSASTGREKQNWDEQLSAVSSSLMEYRRLYESSESTRKRMQADWAMKEKSAQRQLLSMRHYVGKQSAVLRRLAALVHDITGKDPRNSISANLGSIADRRTSSMVSGQGAKGADSTAISKLDDTSSLALALDMRGMDSSGSSSTGLEDRIPLVGLLWASGSEFDAQGRKVLGRTRRSGSLTIMIHSAAIKPTAVAAKLALNIASEKDKESTVQWDSLASTVCVSEFGDYEASTSSVGYGVQPSYDSTLFYEDVTIAASSESLAAHAGGKQSKRAVCDLEIVMDVAIHSGQLLHGVLGKCVLPLGDLLSFDQVGTDMLFFTEIGNDCEIAATCACSLTFHETLEATGGSS